jgi:hypothetical protein
MTLYRLSRLAKTRLSRLAAAFTLALLFCLTLLCLSCAAAGPGSVTPTAGDASASDGATGLQNVVNGVVNLSVEACDVAQVVAGSPVVTLVCSVVGAVEKTVQVLVDGGLWASMQADYVAIHGTLPAGMKAYAFRSKVDAGKK